MSEQVGKRSATETLVRVLEEFGTAEPVFMIVVWTDESGDVAFSRTEQTSTTYQLGLLESAKMMIGGYLGAQKDAVGE